MIRLAVLLLAAGLPVPAPAGQFTLDGNEIVIHVPGAPARRGTAVIGAQLALPGYGTLHIRNAEPDGAARFPDLWLYQLDTDEGSLCEADATGDTRAVLLPGYFDAELAYQSDPTQFSLSCVSGVQAKCLRWGYMPWRTAPLTGASLAPYYQACIRMARADYCGNDQPTTRAGTLIDIYDQVGVQQPDPAGLDLHFEAGWNATGAVCVAHARIPEHLDLHTLPAHCPRLSADQLGTHCTEATATSMGALLFNRSRPGPSHPTTAP